MKVPAPAGSKLNGVGAVGSPGRPTGPHRYDDALIHRPAEEFVHGGERVLVPEGADGVASFIALHSHRDAGFRNSHAQAAFSALLPERVDRLDNGSLAICRIRSSPHWPASTAPMHRGLDRRGSR